MKLQRSTGRRQGVVAMHARRAQRAAGRVVMATAGYAAGYFLDPEQGPERRRRARQAALDYLAARQRRRAADPGQAVVPPVRPVHRAA